MNKVLVSINLGALGSTGGIMDGISDVAIANGYSAYRAYPWDPNNRAFRDGDILIGSKYGRKLSTAAGMFTGFNGCFSVFSTIRFLKRLDKIKPDIIHLHNLHNCYINLPMLFKYIKSHNICTVWTLHDCWAFTGQCPHFTMVKCEKWKTGCYDCPQYNKYPRSIVDQTKIMWKLKRKWFTNIKNMTIVTPSIWLAELVKESFLKEYSVKVINNGIDLEIFKPTESDFRAKHNMGGGVKIILGVAYGWGKRKGLDVFTELSRKIDRKKYQIVLVGTDDDIDGQLPTYIISIHKTQDRRELAEIYSAADVFVNPTREEVFGLVNLEALACGTPVIAFRSGGSPECIDSASGEVIECDDIDAMEENIYRITQIAGSMSEKCIERARLFEKQSKYLEYIKLYKVV